MIRRSDKKIRVAVSATLILMGLFLPMAKTQAQESMQSMLMGIVGRITSLLNIGGNKELSPEQKLQQELQTRKDAVSEIYDLTLAEQNDLLARLAALDNLTATQEKMRSALKNKLTENESSFNQIRDRLRSVATIEDVKQLAADFKNWRTLVYDQKAGNVAAFTFVFQENGIITTAKQRLEKISKDLSGRKSSPAEADTLLEKAAEDLKDAEDLHNQAKIQIMVALTDQADLTGSKIINRAVTDEIAASMTDARNFTEQSFQGISDAYRIFLEIGRIIK